MSGGGLADLGRLLSWGGGRLPVDSTCAGIWSEEGNSEQLSGPPRVASAFAYKNSGLTRKLRKRWVGREGRATLAIKPRG